ncbi:hypothetical protein KRP22_014106 [Phytophthora ramorum]|nr:Sterol 3-beta-glucosyltransferase UGT80B1 [Phytophthora ramorum]
MISPLVGTVVFADHLATGAYNNIRGDDDKRKGSLIADNKKFLNAIGIKTRNHVHNGSMSADELVDAENSLATQISIQLTPDEKSKLEGRFNALVKERKLHKKSFKLSKSSVSTLASTESSEETAAVVVNVESATFNGSDSFEITFGDGGKVGEALLEHEVQEMEDEARKEEAAHKQRLESLSWNAGTPLIYFGFQCGDWDPRRVQDLVSTLEKAARKANVRVVFHGYENSNDDAAFFVGGNDMVFEIDQNFPVKRILPHVYATVHWGDLSITSTCLAAEKPACVVPRNITQRMWGQALVLTGAGVEPLEIDALTPSNLVHVFRVLLDPKLAHCAKRLAPKFSSSNAIETAVSAFYGNLPLAGMTCDLDPARIARVYDSIHEMKLSYEARLVVHQITNDKGSSSDLKYKPLKYSQHHPPRFSLRELETELLHSSSSGNLKKHNPRVLYTYDPVSEELAAKADHQRALLNSSSTSGGSLESAISKKNGGAPRKRNMELSRAQSMALNVVEMPKFWSSPEEQAKSTLEINSKYENLLMGRKFANGSSSSSVSSVVL